MSCFMDNVQFIKIVPKVAENGINDIIIISDDNNTGDSVKLVFDYLLPHKRDLTDVIENHTFTALAINQETGEIVGEAKVMDGELKYFYVDKEAKHIDIDKLYETLFEYVVCSNKVSYITLCPDAEQELLRLCETHGWSDDKSFRAFAKTK